MKKIIIACFILSFLPVAAKNAAVGLRYDFRHPQQIRTNWEFHGAVLLVPKTGFRVARIGSAEDQMALIVEANSSSGVLMTAPKVDLRKYPVLRWKWRVIRPMQIAANTPNEPDDQVAVVYLGDGTMIKQKCIGYRWEHHTRIGTVRNLKYASGMMHVSALCIRNKNTKPGEWVVEERNIVQDFFDAYGRFPGNYFVLGIGANSQYSKSNTRVEIDYIEFVAKSDLK